MLGKIIVSGTATPTYLDPLRIAFRFRQVSTLLQPAPVRPGSEAYVQAQAGSSKIPVGQVIAVLAEEGDDLASIEVPSNLAPEGQEKSSSSSSSASSSSASEKSEKPESPKKGEEKKAESSLSPAPKQESSATESGSGHGHKEIKHSKPLFPSVSRL